MLKANWTISISNNEGVVDSTSCGYESACLEHSFAFHKIREHFKTSTSTEKHWFQESFNSQVLINSSVSEWHSYGLVWGDALLEDKLSCWPDGVATTWTLFRSINGIVEAVVSGELPKGWWSFDLETRQQIQRDFANSQES